MLWTKRDAGERAQSIQGQVWVTKKIDAKSDSWSEIQILISESHVMKPISQIVSSQK